MFPQTSSTTTISRIINDTAKHHKTKIHLRSENQNWVHDTGPSYPKIAPPNLTCHRALIHIRKPSIELEGACAHLWPGNQPWYDDIDPDMSSLIWFGENNYIKFWASVVECESLWLERLAVWDASGEIKQRVPWWWSRPCIICFDKFGVDVIVTFSREGREEMDRQLRGFPMSLRRYEWRVCFCGQTKFKPWFIYNAHSNKIFGLRWNFRWWETKVYKIKGLIVHPVVWEYLCGILEVLRRFPKFPNGVPLE